MVFGVEVIIACILIAAVISFLIMLVVRRSLKSVKNERSACNYVRSGSFRLTGQQDVFLYSNVTRRRRSQQNSSGRRRR